MIQLRSYTMEEVVECLYNKECNGKVVIDDTLKAAIDAYYEAVWCKVMTGGMRSMEKAYKAMTAAGAANIVTGVIMIVAGVSAGIVTIVHGARLLKHKKEVIF